MLREPLIQRHNLLKSGVFPWRPLSFAGDIRRRGIWSAGNWPASQYWPGHQTFGGEKTQWRATVCSDTKFAPCAVEFLAHALRNSAHFV